MSAEETKPDSEKDSTVGKIPVFAIPVVNRGDLLERLVVSLDYPIKKLLIINNGQDTGVQSVIEKIQAGLNPLVETVEIYSEGKNLGVAPSWNRIVSQNLDDSYWFICANDMFFHQKGVLKTMYEFAQAEHLGKGMIYADGYSCFCMTRLGWDKIGSFDENIFPAYMEDCDHFYRARLSLVPICGFPDGCVTTHGDDISHGSSTIFANEKYKAANGITHKSNYDYYMLKWGGPNGLETYKTPFNDPSASLDFWKLDLARRKKHEQIWGI